MDRAGANLPEKLQITPVKGVGIVNAIRLSALFFNGMAWDTSMKLKLPPPSLRQPVTRVEEAKRVPSVLNLLRMRSDFARRQQVTGTWTGNLNVEDTQS